MGEPSLAQPEPSSAAMHAQRSQPALQFQFIQLRARRLLTDAPSSAGNCSRKGSMDSFVLAVGVGVLCGLSVHAGNHWAKSTLQAVLWAVPAALAAVLSAFVTALIIARIFPDIIDPPQTALWLVILLLGGPVVAAVLATGTRRRALKAAVAVQGPPLPPTAAKTCPVE
jgi:hypothetical protein